LSTDGLDKHKKSEVKRLLSEYSDVFAQDDLDLGNVTEIEYAFDTDTAEPVKQRMRSSKHGSLCTIVLHRLAYGLILELMPILKWRVE
jgi:hypothetical protein